MNLNTLQIKDCQKKGLAIINRVYIKFAVRPPEKPIQGYLGPITELNKDIQVIEYSLNIYSIHDLRKKMSLELASRKRIHDREIRNLAMNTDEKSRGRLAYLTSLVLCLQMLIDELLPEDGAGNHS
jgi:hypothetical protein